MAGGLVVLGPLAPKWLPNLRMPFWLKLAPAPLRCPFSPDGFHPQGGDGTGVIVDISEGNVIRSDRGERHLLPALRVRELVRGTA